MVAVSYRARDNARHPGAEHRTLAPVALYAAYGSNMDPAQMLLRCPHSPQRGTGWLEGWRLTFGGEDIGWDGAMATVVEEPGARVFVVLYDVSQYDEKELDNWDGVNLGYYRKGVRLIVVDPDSPGSADSGATSVAPRARSGGLPSIWEAAFDAGPNAEHTV